MKSGFVSVIGRPNVGKSTLVNKLIGSKIAIVSDKPQTTRTRIQGILTSESGQIIFIDTPGMHKPKHLLGEYMMKVSTQSLDEVDIIYYITDVTSPFGPGEKHIIDQLRHSKVPIFLLVNKVDLVQPQEVQQFMQSFCNQMKFMECIPI